MNKKNVRQGIVKEMQISIGDQVQAAGITMTTTAIQRMNSVSADVYGLPYRRILRACVLFMSKVSSRKKRPNREDLSPQETFEAMLEGYLMSNDAFPVCQRHLYDQNAVHAVLKAFWAVGAEINRGMQDLIDEPKLKLESVNSDDEQQRRAQAARRVLAAVERTRNNRSKDES